MGEAHDPDWSRPHQRLRKELKNDEWDELERVKSIEMLHSRVSTLKQQRLSRCREETWIRLGKVISLLTPVAQAADVLAHGMCLPSNTLWGSLALVIKAVSSKADLLDTVLNSYEALLDVLPRVSTFDNVLEKSPSLRLAIADVYDAYATLSIRALKSFGRGSRLTPWATFRWMRERKSFETSIKHIQRLVGKVYQEAGHALGEHRQAEQSKTLHDTLQNTEVILAALKLDGSRPHGKSESAARTIRFTVPAQNPSFVGRVKLIDDLHAYLGPAQTATDPGRRRSVAICGLGGMGKTQLAQAYAHKYKDMYQACFWVTCDSEVKAAEGFADIARALGIEDLGVTQNFGNVKDWLQKTDDQWLLIFDNAESPSMMTDFWPRSSNGAILLTTQDGSWLSQEYITHGFRLNSMAQSEGVDLIRSLFKKKQRDVTDDEAMRIFNETEGLPLAMRQITSYILAENITIDLFIHNYQSYRSSKRVDTWGESATMYYPQTLATFLDLPFAKLTPRAISIMAIIGFLDVDKIQEKLLGGGESPSRDVDEWESDDEDDEDDYDCQDDGQDDVMDIKRKKNNKADKSSFTRLHPYDEDISSLCRYSLISKEQDQDGGTFFSLHRQVKRHILTRLPPKQLSQGALWAIRQLRLLFPRQSPFSGELGDGNSQCAPCIKHILALKGALSAMKQRLSEHQQDLASLYLDGGIYLWSKGLLADGRDLTGAAKQICDTSTHVDRPMTAQVYSFHASILSDSGHNEQGLEFFEKSLGILREHLASIRDMATPSDYALLANAYNNLAAAQCALGNYRKAEMFNDLSLRWKRKLEREGCDMSHLLCLSYQNMAYTYARQGRYDEAAGYFEKAIEVATLQESTSRRALTSHNFGIMRLEQNRVDEARQLFETACRLRSETLSDHPDTAASQHMLACCYHRMGGKDNLGIARHLLQDSLRILESRPSSVDESRVARTLFKLSRVQEALGDPAAARHSRQEAERLYHKLTKDPSLPTTEDEFDVLVPYI